MGIQREPLNLEEWLRNFYLLLRNSNQPWNGPLDVLLCTPSPKSFSRSQLLLRLAGVQLDPRATCALRWPESPSDSLNICENEPDQRRNISVPLGRERLGAELFVWGSPAQSWSPFLAWGGQDNELSLATNSPLLRVMEQGWTGSFQDITLSCDHQGRNVGIHSGEAQKPSSSWQIRAIIIFNYQCHLLWLVY